MGTPLLIVPFIIFSGVVFALHAVGVPFDLALLAVYGLFGGLVVYGWLDLGQFFHRRRKTPKEGRRESSRPPTPV